MLCSQGNYLVTEKKYLHTLFEATFQCLTYIFLILSRKWEIWLKSFSHCLENQSNVNEFWEINDVLLFSQGGYINPLALLAKYVPTKLIQLDVRMLFWEFNIDEFITTC